MHRLAYIRVGTYVFLAFTFLWPTAKTNVIPVDLAPPPAEESIEAAFDRFYRKRQEAEDIARKPGFETTKRSGSEILRLALERARREGIDLVDYRLPTITLFRKDEKMKWDVGWELKGAFIGGGFFAIVVDDESGETTLFPGIWRLDFHPGLPPSSAPPVFVDARTGEVWQDEQAKIDAFALIRYE